METNPHHPFVKLAIEAIDHYTKSGETLAASENLPPEQKTPRGVFVSIKKSGRLRGCIGTIRPVRENLAEEIIANAVSAAARDPRFDPVADSELEQLDITVDVLTVPEPVEDVSELDPKKYGIIVSREYQQGVLLPDIGVKTVAEQIEICRQKADITPGEEVEIQKFEVVRYY